MILFRVGIFLSKAHLKVADLVWLCLYLMWGSCWLSVRSQHFRYLLKDCQPQLKLNLLLFFYVLNKGGGLNKHGVGNSVKYNKYRGWISCLFWSQWHKCVKISLCMNKVVIYGNSKKWKQIFEIQIFYEHLRWLLL